MWWCLSKTSRRHSLPKSGDSPWYTTTRQLSTVATGTLSSTSASRGARSEPVHSPFSNVTVDMVDQGVLGRKKRWTTSEQEVDMRWTQVDGASDAADGSNCIETTRRVISSSATSLCGDIPTTLPPLSPHSLPHPANNSTRSTRNASKQGVCPVVPVLSSGTHKWVTDHRDNRGVSFEISNH